MKECRICSTKLNSFFLSLGKMPLSNSYILAEDLCKSEKYYPLNVFVCRNCFLVQIDNLESPENIFSDYAYFSSYSDSWLTHCEQYVNSMIRKYRFNKKSLIVEIASNDGYLLQYFKNHKIPVLGIEPASNVAEKALAKGIPTDITFFNKKYATQMVANGWRADLIIGNNVLAHNPFLNDFVGGLKIALKPDGIITMEFPHLLKLMKGNQFDTIYHEHYSYFSLYTVRLLFDMHGLEIFDVDELPTHGGSLRIYARNNTGFSPVYFKSKNGLENIESVLDAEKQEGLYNLTTYNYFADNVNRTKRDLLNLLIKIKNKGKRIVGYGAPAKGNTMLNYCGIGTDFLDYTVDRNPFKQNKFLPGSHIPVYPPHKLKEDKPDYILILPWNIKGEIIEQISYVREWNTKFIVPVPKPEVL